MLLHAHSVLLTDSTGPPNQEPSSQPSSMEMEHHVSLSKVDLTKIESACCELKPACMKEKKLYTPTYTSVCVCVCVMCVCVYFRLLQT